MKPLNTPNIKIEEKKGVPSIEGSDIELTSIEMNTIKNLITRIEEKNNNNHKEGINKREVNEGRVYLEADINYTIFHINGNKRTTSQFISKLNETKINVSRRGWASLKKVKNNVISESSPQNLIVLEQIEKDYNTQLKKYKKEIASLKKEVKSLKAIIEESKNPVSVTYGYLEDFDDEFLYGALANQNGDDMYIFQTERSKIYSEIDLMIGMGIQVEIQNNKIKSVDIDKREQKPVETTTNFDELEQLFAQNGDFPTL